MIYPTRRAVIAMAAGLPPALLVGVLAPAGWLTGLAWIGLVALFLVVDALSAASRGGLTLEPTETRVFSVARAGQARFVANFVPARRPSRASAALEADERLGLEAAFVDAEVEAGVASFAFPLTPERRGSGKLARLWVRWTGPLGLAWKQKAFDLDVEAVVGTDLAGVREAAVKMLARDAAIGAKTQIERGEGSEFEALREFRLGMDRRAIDWKQSARHMQLLAKEFRTERNHQVVMAMDCGRAMCEPVGGAPRIDRAIHAALLLALACLRSGDRAGFFAFDSAPRLLTGVVGGGIPLFLTAA